MASEVIHRHHRFLNEFARQNLVKSRMDGRMDGRGF